MPRLILEENSFKFTNKLYLQRHGTSMGTKAAVVFANIFMAEIETQILRQSKHKPLEWICYIDNIVSLWVTSKDEVLQFIQKANQFHPTIKFTAEISDSEATFLGTTIYKGVFTLISNRQRNFNTHTSNQVTRQELKKVLSKAKP